MDDDISNNAWTIALVILALIVFCWMTKRQPVDRNAILRGRVEAAAEDPEDRKVRIEKAITIQKVIGCDKDGNLQLGSTESSTASSEEEADTTTTDEEEGGAPCCQASSPTESSSCCICLEVYQVGEIVAWNRQRRCLHVFHQECLAEWLVKHNDCPTCRLPIVPKDKSDKEQQPDDSTANPTEPNESEDDTSTDNHNDDDSVASASSSSPGAFAIVHGLIARVRDGLHNSKTNLSPKLESPTAIFRRRVMSFGGGGTPQNWAPVRGSSSSTASSESSDEEMGIVAPLRRVASFNDTTSCAMEHCVQIVQTTQPWTLDDEEDSIWVES